MQRGALGITTGLGAAPPALVIVPAVGWTSASAVHRIPRRRWWTALRLSTLGCPVAGTVIKAAPPAQRPLERAYPAGVRRATSEPLVPPGAARPRHCRPGCVVSGFLLMRSRTLENTFEI